MNYELAEEALVHAVELGLNVIDTAEMYGGGRAEELVGRVVGRSVGMKSLLLLS